MKWLRTERFWVTERKIFDAYFDLKHRNIIITPGVLAKMVGISRATLYRHHLSISRMRKEYEKMLLREYKSSMKGLRHGLPAEKLLYRMLFFILRYEKACKLLLEDGDENLVREMLIYIKPEIIKTSHFTKMPTIVFEIYAGEIYALIADWEKRGFAKNELEIVHRNIVYLTKTAAKRLSVLKAKDID